MKIKQIEGLDERLIEIENKLIKGNDNKKNIYLGKLSKKEYFKVFLVFIFYIGTSLIFTMSVLTIIELISTKGEIGEGLALIVLGSSAGLFKMSFDDKFYFFNNEDDIGILGYVTATVGVVIALLLFIKPLFDFFNL